MGGVDEELDECPRKDSDLQPFRQKRIALSVELRGQDERWRNQCVKSLSSFPRVSHTMVEIIAPFTISILTSCPRPHLIFLLSAYFHRLLCPLKHFDKHQLLSHFVHVISVLKYTYNCLILGAPRYCQAGTFPRRRKPRICAVFGLKKENSC